MRHHHAVPDPSFFDRVAPSAVGALIGLVGLFGVWWLTQRATRKRETLARTSESVAMILQSAQFLTTDPPLGPDDVGRYARDLLRFAHSLSIFGAREIREHPKLARLAFENGGAIAAWSFRLRSAKDSGEVAEITSEMYRIVGTMTGLLVKWLEDPKQPGLPDPERPPRKQQ